MIGANPRLQVKSCKSDRRREIIRYFPPLFFSQAAFATIYFRIQNIAFKSNIENRKNFMKTILPNSTIGVFGSGQLGRMFAVEARKMGYRVHTFSPANDTPTGQVADFETAADYQRFGVGRKICAKR